MISICDLTKMTVVAPGRSVTYECEKLFICGTITGDVSSLSLTTDSIFVGPGATIKNIQPQAASSGHSGNDIITYHRFHIHITDFHNRNWSWTAWSRRFAWIARIRHDHKSQHFDEDVEQPDQLHFTRR